MNATVLCRRAGQALTIIRSIDDGRHGFSSMLVARPNIPGRMHVQAFAEHAAQNNNGR
jgi:hypothetical protein